MYVCLSFLQTRTFVGDFDEESETLAAAERQTRRDFLAEVLPSGTRLDLDRLKGDRLYVRGVVKISRGIPSQSNLVRVVRKVDFVKDLRRFVLNCFHFHLVGRILSLTASENRWPIPVYLPLQ